MEKLDSLLEKHLAKARAKFDELPVSNNHEGLFSGIQNMLDDAIALSNVGEKILNDELNSMIDFINENLVDDYTDEQMDSFIAKAKKAFEDLGIDVINETIGQ